MGTGVKAAEAVEGVVIEGMDEDFKAPKRGDEVVGAEDGGFTIGFMDDDVVDGAAVVFTPGTAHLRTVTGGVGGASGILGVTTFNNPNNR